MKICIGCGEDKDESQFSVKRKNKDGSIALRPRCKRCLSEDDASYYKRNRDVIIERVKSYSKDNPQSYNPVKNIKRHGLTIEQFEKLKSRYDGLCWVCREREGTHVDHDHECCNKVHSCGNCIRGILCRQCNVGIGMLGDSLEGLRKAQAYLQTYSQK